MRRARLLLGLFVALPALLAGPATGHAADSSAGAATIRAAAQWAKPVMGELCDFAPLIDGNAPENGTLYDIPYRMAGQGQDEPDRHMTLVRLFCFNGSFNDMHVFVGRDQAERDFQLIAFAEPVIDYDYADAEFSRLKAPPVVSGFATRFTLANSVFDPATRRIRAGAHWSGLGDTWNSGTWEFIDGQFVLKSFEIDPTYTVLGKPADAGQPESYVVYPLK